MNLNLFTCALLLTWIVAAKTENGCTSTSECPEYYECSQATCKCKYGGTNTTSGNVTCYECKSRFQCTIYSRCTDHKCKCKYGGGVIDSSGRLSKCYECSAYDHCPGKATCEDHKCYCKYGGGTEFLGKLVSCSNDCGSDDDCPDNSICTQLSICTCEYGYSYDQYGTTGACATNLATVVSAIVGTVFFLSCIIVCICARRKSIARENAAKFWASSQPVIHSDPETEKSSYAQQHYPVSASIDDDELFNLEFQSTSSQYFPKIRNHAVSTSLPNEGFSIPGYFSETNSSQHYSSVSLTLSDDRFSHRQRFPNQGDKTVSSSVPNDTDSIPGFKLAASDSNQAHNPVSTSLSDEGFSNPGFQLNPSDFINDHAHYPVSTSLPDEGFSNPGYQLPASNSSSNYAHKPVSTSLPDEGFSNPGYNLETSSLQQYGSVSLTLPREGFSNPGYLPIESHPSITQQDHQTEQNSTDEELAITGYFPGENEASPAQNPN